MSLLAYFLRLSGHNLRRGGQRAWVALLCIAFGVMSLTAMTLLSQSLARMLVVDPRDQIGGDFTLDRQQEDSISPENIAELDALQKEGILDRYTLIAYTSGLAFHFPGSGELHFAAAGMGIDPRTYPLAGAFILGEPGNVGLTTLLQREGDVLVTQDLERDFNLHLGDTLLLADLNTGTPVTGRIRGIITDTPNHQGGKIYYSMATAQRIAGKSQAANTAVAISADPEVAVQRLDESGWRVYPAAKLAGNNRQTQELFDILLKGAGILGLMVGGIGIANTMQVLLRRRRTEIAVWKTLGYRESELQVLFVSEAFLLGVLGSLVGAGLGLAVSFGLVDLFSRTTNLMIRWSFSPTALVLGFLVGIFTTVIFAAWAITASSRVEPLALLRNEPVGAMRLPKARALGLALALGIPFTLVTSLVMGSLLKGAGLLLFSLAGLAGLGGLLGGIVWLAVRLLPLRGLPLAAMAQTSLKRRGLGLVFAMIALFTGVVALALGVAVTQSAGREMDERTIPMESYNLTVIATAQAEDAVRAAFAVAGLEKQSVGYRTAVKTISSPDTGERIILRPLLVGREEPFGYTLQGQPWGSAPDGAYAYRSSGVREGSQVEVTLANGSTHSLPVVGTYDVDLSAAVLYPDLGLLVPAGLSRNLAPPDGVVFFGQAPEGGVARASAALGQALPQATVINLVAYTARFTQTYHNLFVLAVAMAGLALLAGVLLVANSVSLAMLDRRYEIGVLKAMGYSRGHVLVTLGVEYTLVGLVATTAGLAAVQIFLWILGRLNGLAAGLLGMDLAATLLIGLLGVSLTLLAVLGMAWEPTRVAPSVVLNYRE